MIKKLTRYITGKLESLNVEFIVKKLISAGKTLKRKQKKITRKRAVICATQCLVQCSAA